MPRLEHITRRDLSALMRAFRRSAAGSFLAAGFTTSLDPMIGDVASSKRSLIAYICTNGHRARRFGQKDIHMPGIIHDTGGSRTDLSAVFSSIPGSRT